MKTEPVMTSAFVTFAMSLVAAGITFGYLSWTQEQQDMFKQLLLAAIPVATGVVALVSNLIAKRQVITVEKANSLIAENHIRGLRQESPLRPLKRG